MKNLIKSINFLILGFSFFTYAEQSVAITAITQHPALDAARDGIIDYLKENNKADVKVDYDSAQNDTTIAAQIAQKYASADYDVVVAIATPSALAAKNLIENKPIVFTAVTDPVAAGLLETMDQGGDQITGVSDMAPVEQQIELMKEMLGNDIIIGLPYNPSEANSVALVDIAKDVAEKLKVKIETVAAFTSGEVPQAVSKLVGKVDMIYIINDNTMASSAEVILEMAAEARTPVFSATPENVEKGALVSLGTNYYDIGQQTGQQVVQILDGISPKDIQPIVAKANELIISEIAAKNLGYEFSEELRVKSTKIIE